MSDSSKINHETIRQMLYNRDCKKIFEIFKEIRGHEFIKWLVSYYKEEASNIYTYSVKPPLRSNSSMGNYIYEAYLEDPDCIKWSILANNSSDEACKMLMDNKDKYEFYEMSSNTNPIAVEYVVSQLRLIPIGILISSHEFVNFLYNSTDIACEYIRSVFTDPDLSDNTRREILENPSIYTNSNNIIIDLIHKYADLI